MIRTVDGHEVRLEKVEEDLAKREVSVHIHVDGVHVGSAIITADDQRTVAAIYMDIERQGLFEITGCLVSGIGRIVLDDTLIRIAPPCAHENPADIGNAENGPHVVCEDCGVTLARG